MLIALAEDDGILELPAKAFRRPDDWDALTSEQQFTRLAQGS